MEPSVARIGAPKRSAVGSQWVLMNLVLSCEHASNAVPAGLEDTLAIPNDVRWSHRGWDPGAEEMCLHLGRAFATPVVLGRVCRLVVDLNRSASNRRATSEYARHLSEDQRAGLRAKHHAPHWQAVAAAIDAGRQGGAAVVHVSVHSFTPVLGDQPRRMDIGLLYDPRRALERSAAGLWQQALRARGLRVARNAPYRGRDDGVTAGMRKRYAHRYAGLELEVNQGRLRGKRFEPALVDAVTDTLRSVLDSLHPPRSSGAPTARSPDLR